MPAIRTTYYAKDRLPLITGPLRECYDELRAAYPSAAVFPRSGWLRGSHLDLCVVPPAGGEVDCEPYAQRIRDWVAAHPSTANVVTDEYVALSKKLGAFEGIPGPYTPLRADNSVEVVPYAAPRLVDGHEQLQDAYVDFLGRTAKLVFELAELKRANAPAASMLLIGMMARAADQLKPEGIARGYISLQAHADFFFANYDGSGAVRRHFEQLESEWRDAVDDAVAGRGTLGVPDDVRDRARAVLDGWSAALEAERANVEAIARRDDSWFAYNPTAFPNADAQEQERRAASNARVAAAFADAGLNPGGRIERGRTLETVMQVDESELEFFRSERFQVFRILLNMYYSLLPVLAVSPMERFGMCFLVASSHVRNRVPDAIA